MFCEQCGKRIPNAAAFCPKCGKRMVSNSDHATGEKSDSENNSDGKRRKGTNTLLLSLGGLAVLLAVAGLVTMLRQEPAPDIEKLRADAEKLMLEGEYEEAILLFEQIIEVDPMDAESLIGMAKAYTAIEDDESALMALSRAEAYDPAYYEEYLLMKEPSKTATPEVISTPAATPSQYVGTDEAGEYLTNGIYTIRVYGGVKVLNLSGKTDSATDRDKTNVMIWTSTDSNMQTFRLEAAEGEACYICPLSSSGGYGRVIDVFSNGTAATGDNIDLWQKDDIRSQKFLISLVSNDAYAILLAEDPSLAVTCESISENGANVYLDEFDGRSEQLFAFISKSISAEASGAIGDDWFETLGNNNVMNCIGKKYRDLGEPDEVLVEAEYGILYRYGEIYLIFDDPIKGIDWYGEYFESGIVPPDEWHTAMTGNEICRGAHFWLRDIALNYSYMPPLSVVGNKEIDQLTGEHMYGFKLGAYSYCIYCENDGTLNGNSYCTVSAH